MSGYDIVLGKTLELKSEVVILEDGSKRLRPIQAMSLLGDVTSNKNPAPHPLAYIDEDKLCDPMDGFDKGHVVARQFIGTRADVNGNIVPLEPTFNRSGLWKQLELALHAQVKQGMSILLQVEIEYIGADSLIPSCLVVSARDQKSLDYATFNSIGLKRIRFTPPVILPVQMTEVEMRTDYGDALYDYIIFLEKWFAENIDIKTYDSNKELYDNSAKMGPFGYPRPYQCLDFAFTLVGSNAVKTFLGPRMAIKNGLTFHARQRDLIRLVNRMRNGGWLVSDDPSDVVKGHLAIGAGADAGHVDHIHPKAQSGSNAFSNARLISRKHNEATKDTQKVVAF
jgi:hypothetical protein